MKHIGTVIRELCRTIFEARTDKQLAHIHLSLTDEINKAARKAPFDEGEDEAVHSFNQLWDIMEILEEELAERAMDGLEELSYGSEELAEE